MAGCGARRVLLAAALCALAPAARPDAGPAGDGGWRWRGSAAAAVPEERRCTVERRLDLTYAEFAQRYAFSRPVILAGRVDNSRFRALCSRERLLASFGDRVVRLSTANTYSYRKVDLPFQEYVEHLLRPQDPTSLGNDTLYFFGDNNFTEWASLFQHYSPPPFGLLGTTPAHSFGIAALVPVPPGEDTRVPSQQDHAGLAPGYIPGLGTITAALGVHHPARGGAVLPWPMVACHPQPGHHRLHVYVPQLATKWAGTHHTCPIASQVYYRDSEGSSGPQPSPLLPAVSYPVGGQGRLWPRKQNKLG
ncbi:jmjC domain-containing protein 8 isoform X1 [Sorex fumeus]|uniref:jmjC domain-containing protein 8 isoform X1 n=1 Tax=Sorex fumeus TaxID=62283 RepID=UPI0024AE06E9|nr:jmjC domain-containing protein 8 isoform X1 [Sorex fumeus]